MKKLLTALLLTLSTAALAQSDTGQGSKAQQEDQRNDASRMETGVEATEVLPELSGAKAGTEEEKQAKANLMDKSKAFTVNGTFKGSAMGGVTLSRQNQKLPDVDLDVKDQTQVMLDGKKVALGNIPEGSQVRARFQLEGDDAVALELNATSPKGVGGSGTKDTQ